MFDCASIAAARPAQTPLSGCLSLGEVGVVAPVSTATDCACGTAAAPFPCQANAAPSPAKESSATPPADQRMAGDCVRCANRPTGWVDAAEAITPDSLANGLAGTPPAAPASAISEAD